MPAEKLLTKINESNSVSISSEEVFSAFSRLLQFSRDLNAQLPVPEIVVYGRQSHGKSTLIEALIGQPLTTLGKDMSSILLSFFSSI
jgi:GTP-binding protein EngB required for normal cell division